MRSDIEQVVLIESNPGPKEDVTLYCPRTQRLCGPMQRMSATYCEQIVCSYVLTDDGEIVRESSRAKR